MSGARTASTAHLPPDAHPAHALLSVAHALLCPASAIAISHSPLNPAPPPPPPPAPPASLDVLPIDEVILPIDDVILPEDDVSDLRDVVDAINRLCDTMKTSSYEEEPEEPDEPEESEAPEEALSPCGEDISTAPSEANYMDCASDASEQEINVHYRDIGITSPDATSQQSLPAAAESDTDPPPTADPASEMYYTASSEISLTSDTEPPERPQADEEDPKDERKECVIAGHVAAMRERFESMTRTNTPCPDLARSLSPSLELFRNTSPSPDRLA